MSNEDKFKQWALDPYGGRWPKELPNGGDLWSMMKRAFLAGMEADRWISVEERLPEPNNPNSIFSITVLVWFQLFINGWPTLGYYNFDTKLWTIINQDNATSTDVTHWQPLPNKPQL